MFVFVPLKCYRGRVHIFPNSQNITQVTKYNLHPTSVVAGLAIFYLSFSLFCYYMKSIKVIKTFKSFSHFHTSPVISLLDEED